MWFAKRANSGNGLPGWRRPARSSRPADYSVADRRGPRPYNGEDAHGILQLRLDEPEIFPHGFRERSPPFPRGRNPRRSAEIRPSLELAIDRLASGQGPHARGEFLSRLPIHAVADAHRDPVETAEHIEFRHREAHEAVHADRHPEHDEIEPPDPSRPSGRRAVFASAPFAQMLGGGPVDFGRKRSRPDAGSECLRDADDVAQELRPHSRAHRGRPGHAYARRAERIDPVVDAEVRAF